MKSKLNKQPSFILSIATVGAFSLLLLSGSLSLKPNQVLAQEDPTPTSPKIKKNLLENIEKVLEEKKEQVKGAIDDLSRKKTGFIGQVTRVSEETIAIKTNRGVKILPLDVGVKLFKGTESTTPDKIEVDSWALVMGWIEDDSFVVRRIVFSKNSLRPKAPIVQLGTINDIKTRSIDFQPRGKEEIMTLSTSSSVSYQNSQGEKAIKTDFTEDDQVLLIGYSDTTNNKNVVTTIRALAPFQKDLE